LILAENQGQGGGLVARKGTNPRVRMHRDFKNRAKSTAWEGFRATFPHPI